jgi:hypothetical protein
MLSRRPLSILFSMRCSVRMCSIVQGWAFGKTPYRERSWARREREIVCSVVRAAGAGVGGGPPCARVMVDQNVVLSRFKTLSFSCCGACGL